MELGKSYLEEGWYNQLKHYVDSKDFLDIATSIAKDRKKYIIIPKKGSELFLKVFREVPFNEVTVNVLGQDQQIIKYV